MGKFSYASEIVGAAALFAVFAKPAFSAPIYSPADDPVNLHLAMAQAAAGLDYPGLLSRVCIVPPGGADAQAGRARASADTAAKVAAPPPAPPRADWYQPPERVFDNLYWVGTKEHSAWILKTSAGLVLIDTLFRYAVEPAILDGARKLGLDPKAIKYVIITHGHGDHDQGAKVLQDLGARVLMSAADWDLMLNGRPLPGGNPRRDMVIVDGQKLTLGDTTLTLYITPGHTEGTVSLIFPVRDHGQRRIVAYAGGTAFNFPHTLDRFARYADTQRRFAKIAADAGATVVLSNHSEFDEAWMKVRMIRTLAPGEPNPFVIRDGVQRYFKVMVECSEAEKARLEEGQDLAQER
jgi:metallo-beta-lactamase class B